MKIDNRLVDAKSEAENTENFNRIMSLLDNVNVTQPDWNQNDETAPDYVKNRPFYSEVLNYSITWDGDKTDKVSDSTGMYYKVSGSTPDVSELQKINAVLSDGRSFQGNADDIYGSQGLYWSLDFAVCIFEAGITLQGMVFPETGMYFTSYNGLYVSELEYTLSNVKRISRDYIPSTPEFVVDATNLPSDTAGWRELNTALNDAYKLGHDIFLDIYGDGSIKLKLTNCIVSDYLFLYPDSNNTIHAYILTAYKNDGGSLTELSLTATEVL